MNFLSVIAGAALRRRNDNIGLGYAYREGGNTDVRRPNVVERYYRAVLKDCVALTADIQYMSDDVKRSGRGERPSPRGGANSVPRRERPHPVPLRARHAL